MLICWWWMGKGGVRGQGGSVMLLQPNTEEENNIKEAKTQPEWRNLQLHSGHQLTHARTHAHSSQASPPHLPPPPLCLTHVEGGGAKAAPLPVVKRKVQTCSSVWSRCGCCCCCCCFLPERPSSSDDCCCSRSSSSCCCSSSSVQQVSNHDLQTHADSLWQQTWLKQLLLLQLHLLLLLSSNSSSITVVNDTNWYCLSD